jgi:hypothetical protein
MPSRLFGSRKPVAPHLLTRGLGKEIADLRQDIDDTFVALERGLGYSPVTFSALWLNPTAGDDTKDGTSAGNAVRTPDRLLAILGARPCFRGNFVLHLSGAGPLTADLVLDWVIDSGVVKVVGDKALFASPPVLTAVQARVPSANTRQTITAGSFDWTSSVGKMLRITASANPANVGATSCVIADLTGGRCETGAWMTLVEETMTGAPTEIQPQVGDTVVVESPFQITGRTDIAIDGSADNVGIAGSAKFFLRGVDFASGSSTSGAFNFVSSGPAGYFVDSIVNNLSLSEGLTDANVFIRQFHIMRSSQVGPSLPAVYGGCAFNTFHTIGGYSTVSFQMGHVMKNSTFLITGVGVRVTLFDVAGYDWSGVLVNLRDGATVDIQGAASLYGSSAVAGSNLFRIQGGGTVNKSASTWVLAVPATCASVPFKINAASTGFPFDANSTRTYLAAINITQANLDAAAGASGFGGQYFDPPTGCAFTAG